MKVITLFACLLSFQLFSQQFQIAPDFYDSTGVSSFEFHVTGLATFNDSMTIEVELHATDSLQTVLFTGVHDFTNASTSTLTGFTYNPLTNTFFAPLGTFPTKDMEMWVRSRILGTVREELLIIYFD